MNVNVYFVLNYNIKIQGNFTTTLKLSSLQFVLLSDFVI